MALQPVPVAEVSASRGCVVSDDVVGVHDLVGKGRGLAHNS